jgi:uncharacterized membrane protein (DUF441 family)
MVELFSHLFWFATLAKLVALVLGTFIVYLAYTGYRRNRSKPLLYVALGFGLITAGTIAEGVLYVILGSQLLAAIATGTAVTVIGFIVIIYSIYSVK